MQNSRCHTRVVFFNNNMLNRDSVTSLSVNSPEIQETTPL